MLYKVTPLVPPSSERPKAASESRHASRRRKSAVYDSEGNEVLITLMCLKCHRVKPLVQFGLRKMADGAVRNQPWCRQCRGTAGLTRIGNDSSESGKSEQQSKVES